jgi:predicted RNase H-like nuclease (RuvC/YqgF family)
VIQRSAVATDQPLLPEDPATLQRLLLEAQAEITRLQMLIAGLLRYRFGRRSEQLSDEALDQGIEDLEQSLAEQTAKSEALNQHLGPHRQSVTAERCLLTCPGSKS